MSPFYAFRSSRLWLGAILLCLVSTLAQAQTIRYVNPVANGTVKHLYFRGNKTHFIVQRSQTGLSVYRQSGNRLLPMH